MNLTLNEALALLNLQPGETFRTTVNGRELEVRALKTTECATEPSLEPVQAAEWEMLNLWLDIPPFAKSKIMLVHQKDSLLPAPYHPK